MDWQMSFAVLLTRAGNANEAGEVKKLFGNGSRS